MIEDNRRSGILIELNEHSERAHLRTVVLIFVFETETVVHDLCELVVRGLLPCCGISHRVESVRSVFSGRLRVRFETARWLKRGYIRFP